MVISLVLEEKIYLGSQKDLTLVDVFNKVERNVWQDRRILQVFNPGYQDAPQGVGRGFVPKDSDAWETQEKNDAYTQQDPWKTFEEDLDPKVARW
jgi:hypothetical protein